MYHIFVRVDKKRIFSRGKKLYIRGAIFSDKEEAKEYCERWNKSENNVLSHKAKIEFNRKRLVHPR